MNSTKIIATVGPSCRTRLILKNMINQGVDIFRINASQTTPKELKNWIRRIRACSGGLAKKPAILIDLQGPRLRTGRLKRTPLLLKKSRKVIIKVGEGPGADGTIVIPCVFFPLWVKKQDTVYIDNGKIRLRVIETKPDSVICRVIRAGRVGEFKGINLPSVSSSFPVLSQKDILDLQIACRLSVDYIALSFVRGTADVLAIKKWLGRYGVWIPVVSKIEMRSAVKNINAIIKISDAVMVARGDLGVEMSARRVPGIQKKILAAGKRAKVPVMVATGFLDSMIDKARPKRSEILDIVHTVAGGAAALTLTGETAIGRYPAQTVGTMKKIIEEAEKKR